MLALTGSQIAAVDDAAEWSAHNPGTHPTLRTVAECDPTKRQSAQAIALYRAVSKLDLHSPHGRAFCAFTEAFKRGPDHAMPAPLADGPRGDVELSALAGWHMDGPQLVRALSMLPARNKCTPAELAMWVLIDCMARSYADDAEQFYGDEE